MDEIGAPSGLGVARPVFVSSPRTGAMSTPQIPTINAQQFGAAPNWAQAPAAHAESALLGAQRRRPVED
jgi:hypothetical protein